MAVKTKTKAAAAKVVPKKGKSKTSPQAARPTVRVVRPSGMQARGR
jgi:hypothetical protein